LSTSRSPGLMEAMIRAGDPTGALRHFQLHAALVHAELDCPPSRELLALAESVNGGTSTLEALAVGSVEGRHSPRLTADFGSAVLGCRRSEIAGPCTSCG
jgi:hypothetical protein